MGITTLLVDDLFKNTCITNRRFKKNWRLKIGHGFTSFRQLTSELYFVKSISLFWKEIYGNKSGFRVHKFVKFYTINQTQLQVSFIFTSTPSAKYTWWWMRSKHGKHKGLFWRCVSNSWKLNAARDHLFDVALLEVGPNVQTSASPVLRFPVSVLPSSRCWLFIGCSHTRSLHTHTLNASHNICLTHHI